MGAPYLNLGALRSRYETNAESPVFDLTKGKKIGTYYSARRRIELNKNGEKVIDRDAGREELTLVFRTVAKLVGHPIDVYNTRGLFVMTATATQ